MNNKNRKYIIVVMGVLIWALLMFFHIPSKEQKKKGKDEFDLILSHPQDIEEVLIQYNYSDRFIITIKDRKIINKIIASSKKNFGEVPPRSAFRNKYTIKMKIKGKYYEYKFVKRMNATRMDGTIIRPDKIRVGGTMLDPVYIKNPLDDLGQLSLFKKPYSSGKNFKNDFDTLVTYDHLNLIPVFEKYIDPKFRKMIKEHRKRKSK